MRQIALGTGEEFERNRRLRLEVPEGTRGVYMYVRDTINNDTDKI